MNFFVKYLCLAVIASIAVYGFAPLLTDGGRPAANEDRMAPIVPVSSEPAIEPVEAVPLVSASTGESVAAVAEDPAPAPVAPPPASAEPAESPAPAVIVETVRGYTPSTDRIRSSGPGVEFWGVTLTEASLFEQNGKRREDKLPGGTLIEQIGSVQSSKGEMAKVRVWRGSAWTGIYLVSTADLVRFPGGREEVDADGVTDLCAYFALSARLDQRKDLLKQQAAGKSPHYAALKAAATEYNAFVDKAKRLTKERDQAKGAKRTQIADELRKLEISNKKLERKVQDLTKKYEAWKKTHGVEQVAFESDPRVQAISAEMAKIKPRLVNFGL